MVDAKRWLRFVGHMVVFYAALAGIAGTFTVAAITAYVHPLQTAGFFAGVAMGAVITLAYVLARRHLRARGTTVSHELAVLISACLATGGVPPHHGGSLVS